MTILEQHFPRYRYKFAGVCYRDTSEDTNQNGFEIEIVCFSFNLVGDPWVLSQPFPWNKMEVSNEWYASFRICFLICKALYSYVKMSL